MSVQFPRPLSTGPRIYGLGMRQLIYMGASTSAGGLFALGVFTPGIPFLLRGLVALLVASLGVCLAFLKIGGHHIDRQLGAGLRYLFQPKQMVWRREDQTVEVIDDPLTLLPDAPLVSMGPRSAQSVPLAAVVALLNLMVIVTLLVTTHYMASDGLFELRLWLQRIL